MAHDRPMAPGEHRSDEQHRDEHTADRLWGTETQRAIENFPISGRPMPVSVVRWLAIIKREAARVNVELGLLDDGLAGDIVAAADAIANGEHDDQFPIDVYQTGSGTSTNMNVNEVIATLTGGVAHPNDHVNLGQSSNDTVPTAAQLAALELIEQRFVPTIGGLIDELRARAADFDDVVKPGRTHLMDAVPVVLGHEFGAYAAQLEECLERVVTAQPALGRVPLGGTAVGNGIGSHREFGDLVLRRVSDAGLLVTPLATPGDRIARQGSHDAMVAMSGALEVTAVALTKICNDLRWMASGPDTGLAEIRLPALQKGSSIMPGKVNPVIPEAVLQVAARVVGNHATMTVAGMSGTLELNVMIPVMAASLLESIELLSNGMGVLTDKCVAGIEADRDRCRALAERSLAIATALNADLGYERVEQIVKEADRTDRPVREVAREHGVEEFVLDRALDLDRIARGG